jgi:tetratricopeptide (TPR) repeat protein
MTIHDKILSAIVVGCVSLLARGALIGQEPDASGETGAPGTEPSSPPAAEPDTSESSSPAPRDGAALPPATEGEPVAPPPDGDAAAPPSGAVVPSPEDGVLVPAEPEAAFPPDAGGVLPAEDGQGGQGGISSGLRKVWNVLSGESETIPRDPLDKGSSDESQRKVNELIRLANTSIEKSRVTEANRYVNELIGLKPYDADFHFALGLCHRAEGKYKEALRKYQDVLDLGGPKALVALLKAEAYAAEKNREKVYDLLKEAAVGGRNIINDVKNLPLLVEYQNDTEFIKLALQLEKFEVSASKRRDPFTNPFPKPETQPGATDEEAQVVTLTPEEQEKVLHDAKKTYERVLFYIKLEDETKAMKAYTSLRDLLRKKDLITIPKIVNDFKILIARLEELEVQIEGIRLKYYYNQAQQKLNLMKEAFTDGEYPRVELLHGEVAKLTKEMQATNARYKPIADEIQTVSNRWLDRSKIRQEFHGRKPRINGIIIADDSKMALLNDRLIRQGEAVDDFRVVKVESNRVTFRYKGEEIPLVFRRY